MIITMNTFSDSQLTTAIGIASSICRHDRNKLSTFLSSSNFIYISTDVNRLNSIIDRVNPIIDKDKEMIERYRTLLSVQNE